MLQLLDKVGDVDEEEEKVGIPETWFLYQESKPIVAFLEKRKP